MDDLFTNEINFDAPKLSVIVPEDDLSAPATPQGTIIYLTISIPHTDTWEWHGPFSSFTKILSLAHQAAKDSPSALATLTQVATKGFTKLVVQDATDKTHFAVIQVVTELNPEVSAALPLPVFTVTSTGPLSHDVEAFTGKVLSGEGKGRATTSKIIGSYTDRNRARAAAEQTMQDLLARETEPPRPASSFPAMDAGGGLIMALNARAKWEVRVFFETDPLHGAVRRFDEDRWNVEKGKRASWRLTGGGASRGRW